MWIVLDLNQQQDSQIRHQISICPQTAKKNLMILKSIPHCLEQTSRPLALKEGTSYKITARHLILIFKHSSILQ